MNNSPFVVLVSANAEWQSALGYYGHPDLRQTPFGEEFSLPVEGRQVIFLQGGWGKISAAASTQYCISTYHPLLLINPGTCGGITGRIERGKVLLAEETLVYDIYERMGDSSEAIQFYSSKLDLSFLRSPLPVDVVRGRLLSADQDIDPSLVPHLIKEYAAAAADWESGAIAWTAQRNHTACMILRGVTDLVDPRGGEIYSGIEPFKQRADAMMRSLLENLPAWIRCVDVEKIAKK